LFEETAKDGGKALAGALLPFQSIVDPTLDGDVLRGHASTYAYMDIKASERPANRASEPDHARSGSGRS